MFGVRTRLCTMMVLQYAVWGAWLPSASRYLLASAEEGGLGFNGGQVGVILGLAGAIGALTAPFIAGQIADRYFRAEWVLATLMLLGGIVSWMLAYQTSYAAWRSLSILYSVLFMPTLALSNSIALAHLPDPKRQFPVVRVWGNLGWITPGWVFPMLWLQENLSLSWLPPFLMGDQVADSTQRLADAFKLSGSIAIVYAAYCLFLPRTPPKRDAAEPLAFGKAFRLFTHPSMLVLVLAALAVASIHQIYFIQVSQFLSRAGLEDRYLTPAMTIAQFAEVIVMVMVGLWLLPRLGFRWVMFIGIMAYFCRYAVWGSHEALPLGAVVGSQVFHGFCYACFFACAFIYVDRFAPADVRHSAQTAFGMIILGGGPLLGGYMSGKLQAFYTNPDTNLVNYAGFWYVCALIGLITAITFALLFRDETQDGERIAAAAE
jgi:nucleoside transporter